MMHFRNTVFVQPVREKQSANIGLWFLIVVFGFLPMIVTSASMLMQVLGLWSY